MALDRLEKMLDNLMEQREERSHGPVAKIAVVKPVLKLYRSTRKLVQKLAMKQHPTSMWAVHYYLWQCLARSH